MAMGSSSRSLKDYYSHREADPRISAAFREPAAENIAGTPAFDSLLEHPRVVSFLSSLGYEPCTEWNVSALRGVTVSISLTFTDPSGAKLAAISWKAGSGISFARFRSPD